jgi:hypothetical protein
VTGKSKTNIKEEVKILRKRAKRLEVSRSLLKTKGREKGKTIKMQHDRHNKLKKSRDAWKDKCMKEKKARVTADNKYKEMADLFGIKEEQLREVLKEFEEVKKKYPEKRLKKVIRD